MSLHSLFLFKDTVTGTPCSLAAFKQLFTPKTKGVVYTCGDETFSVLLVRTDVETGKNSFYKLQILVTEEKR
jgi:hypothetical protein